MVKDFDNNVEKLLVPNPVNEGEITIKEYLILLLRTLWREGEGFSGKRPFGNSGWDYDLYIALIKAGYVEGTFDEDGFIEDFDETTAADLIEKVIDSL